MKISLALIAMVLSQAAHAEFGPGFVSLDEDVKLSKENCVMKKGARFILAAPGRDSASYLVHYENPLVNLFSSDTCASGVRIVPASDLAGEAFQRALKQAHESGKMMKETKSEDIPMFNDGDLIKFSPTSEESFFRLDAVPEKTGMKGFCRIGSWAKGKVIGRDQVNYQVVITENASADQASDCARGKVVFLAKSRLPAWYQSGKFTYAPTVVGGKCYMKMPGKSASICEQQERNSIKAQPACRKLELVHNLVGVEQLSWSQIYNKYPGIEVTAYDLGIGVDDLGYCNKPAPSAAECMKSLEVACPGAPGATAAHEDQIKQLIERDAAEPVPNIPAVVPVPFESKELPANLE